MTVPTTTYFSIQNWTGVEGAFNGGFKAESSASVFVFSRDPTTGIETRLTENVHYQVSLSVPDKNVTIIPINLPAPPKTLVFFRYSTPIQLAHFTDLANFSAQVHEILHDRWSLTLSEYAGNVARAPLVPIGEFFTQPIPRLALRANKVAGYDASGNPTALDPATLGGGGGEDFVPIDGSVPMTGNLAISKSDPFVVLNCIDPASFGGRIGYQRNGSHRWWVGMTTEAEAGDAGSNYNIVRLHAVAGGASIIDVPLAISRGTGEVTLIHPLNLPAGVDPTSADQAARKGYVDTLTASRQPLDGDLTALAALTGTNTMYYRSGADTWSPVIIGTGLTFAGGTLSATGGGGGGIITSVNPPFTAPGGALSISLDPTDFVVDGSNRLAFANNATLPGTPALGTSPAAADNSLNLASTAWVRGFGQPLDGDLTALAALTGTNTMYYRSGSNAWSPVAIGTALAFAGGTLAVDLAALPFVLKAGDTMSGDLTVSKTAPSIVLVASGSNDQGTLAFSNAGPSTRWTLQMSGAAESGANVGSDFTISRFSDAGALIDTPFKITRSSGELTVTQPLNLPASDPTSANQAARKSYVDTKQPLDGDLTALAALIGTNTIYYRSGADAWSPVTIGAGLNFTGGTLSAPGGGGGDVFLAGNNTFTGQNAFMNNAVMIGKAAPTIFQSLFELHASEAIAAQHLSLMSWKSASGGPQLILGHSRSGTIGSYTATVSGTNLGAVTFWGSSGTAAVIAASFETTATGAQIGSGIPSATQLFNCDAAGNLIVTARFAPTGSTLFGTTTNDNAAAGYVGEYLEAYAGTSPGVSVPGSTWTTILVLTLTAGDWDVWGTLSNNDAQQFFHSTLTTTAAALDSTSSRQCSVAGNAAGAVAVANTLTPQARFVLASTTNIYLNCYAGNAGTFWGSLCARRRR